MEILKYIEKLNRRSGEPQAYTLIRSLGSKAFSQLGWPSKKLENWRYSPVNRLQDDFIPQTEFTASTPVDVADHSEASSHRAFHTIHINNGIVASFPPELKGSVEVTPLREALQKGLIDSTAFDAITDSLEALNVSFFEYGFYVKIQDRVVIEQPIHWIQTHESAELKPLFQSRLFIHAGKSSSCTFIENHVLQNSKTPAWNNISTTVQVEEKAHLSFIQWAELNGNRQQTSRTNIKLETESFLHLLSGALSSGWVRNDIHIAAQGTNCEIFVHGLGFSRDSGVIDQQTNLVFTEPNNKAEQICKNLLLGHSKAIFNGRICIQSEAQKTDSSQLHQSLLLSSDAEVDTKPELEIYADDVKATHGASIGQLSEDEVFYFQSRGIKRDRAQALLCQAFLLDLCERVANIHVQAFLKDRIVSYWKRESL